MTPPVQSGKRGRWAHVLAGAVALVVLVHAGLFGRYRPVNEDDAWTLSWAYGYVNRGLEVDQVFYGGEGGGVYAFGKIYARFYGHGLNALGWTRANAQRISMVLAFSAAGFWVLTLRRLDYAWSFCAGFGFLLVLCEPFVGMAQMARVDALVFLFGAASLWAFAGGRPFLAGLLAMLGIETHPMGLVAILYASAVWLSRRVVLDDPRRGTAYWGRYALGGVIGLGVYLLLHWASLQEVQQSLVFHRQAGWDVPNYLFHYFFRTKYLRHLPELVLTLGALGLVLAGGRWRREPLPVLVLLAALASTAIVRRPNFHYAVFAYPAFILLWCTAAARFRRLPGLVVLVAALLVPQYVLAMVRNRAHSAGAFQARIDRLSAAVPRDGRPVVGSAHDWFAFADRTFYFWSVAQDRPAPEFHLVEDAEIRAARLRERLADRYEWRKVPGAEIPGVVLYEARRMP